MAKVWEYMIIGGGASGLAAAVFCARFASGGQVLLLEKGPRVGKKLLATGNGTCNLTNIHADGSRYHGKGAEAFVKPALDAFGPAKAISFFESIGVQCTVRENGRVYPLCEQAGAVLDCLRLTLDSLGVTQRCEAAVTAVSRCREGFKVVVNGEEILARRVLMATGGAAAPALGGSAESYGLCVSLGHQKTPLAPSIVQVRTDTTYVRAMKGLRTDATVTFCLNGAPIAQYTDELLFTEYGISGPAVMQISRVVGDWERRRQGELTAVLDLLPTVSEQDLINLLKARRALGRRCEDFLTGLLNKRIGQTVCRVAGIGLQEETACLTDGQIARLCKAIKAFSVTVNGTQGFGGAQVTAGGICLQEVDPHTLESRLEKGLYLLGEVLDVDGDCGGFNLQWAWSSAYVAARSATGGKA